MSHNGLFSILTTLSGLFLLCTRFGQTKIHIAVIIKFPANCLMSRQCEHNDVRATPLEMPFVQFEYPLRDYFDAVERQLTFWNVMNETRRQNPISACALIKLVRAHCAES